MDFSVNLDYSNHRQTSTKIKESVCLYFALADTTEDLVLLNGRLFLWQTRMFQLYRKPCRQLLHSEGMDIARNTYLWLNEKVVHTFFLMLAVVEQIQ